MQLAGVLIAVVGLDLVIPWQLTIAAPPSSRSLVDVPV